jgi:hypothetical protein
MYVHAGRGETSSCLEWAPLRFGPNCGRHDSYWRRLEQKADEMARNACKIRMPAASGPGFPGTSGRG